MDLQVSGIIVYKCTKLLNIKVYRHLQGARQTVNGVIVYKYTNIYFKVYTHVQGARQAVNLVNGVIVDGLGHVSLESPSPLHHQPNIHQVKKRRYIERS